VEFGYQQQIWVR
jgi:hypothetical protein